MKVELISYTQNPIQQMYLAATRCVTAGEVKPSDPETMERVVEKCLNAGHLTVAEFVDFTFSIEGITRSCSHQLVRHRHASFCQMSERRVKIGTPEEYSMVRNTIDDVSPISWPKEETTKIIEKYFSITCNDNELKQAIMDSLFVRFCDYWELIQCGLSVEQARAVLPECTLTNLYMHVNFRALIEMAKLRLCGKAELEIRQLFQLIRLNIGYLMGDTINPEGEFLRKFLQPKCIWLGKCNEAKPCGVYKWEKLGKEESQ